MARQRPSRLLLLPIVPLTLLVFSARSAWMQEIPSAAVFSQVRCIRCIVLAI